MSTTMQTSNQPSNLSDPRLQAIFARYGNLQNFFISWGHLNAGYIYKNVGKSDAAGVPPLVLMRKTYGNEPVAELVSHHLSAALQAMGIIKQFDPATALNTATDIVMSEPAQTLNFARLLAFFVWMRSGNCDLHGYNSYQIMRAFTQQYLPQALNAQLRAYNEIEREKRDAREQEQRENAITFDEYCQQKGITGDNPLEKCLEM